MGLLSKVWAEELEDSNIDSNITVIMSLYNISSLKQIQNELKSSLSFLKSSIGQGWELIPAGLV